VLMNPPFNDPARHRGSPDQARHTAHVATDETLNAWVHAARRILRSDGALTLIWRADGIADVLAALSHGFGSLAILPVHGEAGRPAIRVLVRAVKGGRAPTRVLPGLMLNDGPRVPNNDVRDILDGRAVLPLVEP
jgi:tRNA1(Val) A37 N6-methylase TrmN6